MSSKNDINECCNVISKSVQAIIRWSLNDNFREKCFELLEVQNSFEAENKVRTQLTELNNLLSAKSKPRKHKIKRELDDKDTETSVPQKLQALSTEKVTSTHSPVSGEEFPQWDLGNINVADIDDWN